MAEDICHGLGRVLLGAGLEEASRAVEEGGGELGVLTLINDFYLVDAVDCVGRLLGRASDPVDLGGRRQRAVGFDLHVEAAELEQAEQVAVELEQRLSAGAHQMARRKCGHGVGNLGGRHEGERGEVGVAEGAGAVAARKTQEHRRCARVPPLALERVENFVYGVVLLCLHHFMSLSSAT